MTSRQHATLIDGKALASAAREDVRARVKTLHEQGRPVRLDALLVSGDEAAAVYARNQGEGCRALGIEYHLHELAGGVSEADVAGRVLLLNKQPDVSAIMVHLPLPSEIDTERIQTLIDRNKDVEGVNPANIGRVVYGHRSLVPCTALAVMEMIESTGVGLRGTRCVVVGSSNIVGKPIAVLLMRTDATVVSTNKFTGDLQAITREADVLVSATGVPGLIKQEMVKPGAVVIDVGMSRITDEAGRARMCGDVVFERVREVAGWISPVPGGVGPMTVAMLLRNTVEAAEKGRT